MANNTVYSDAYKMSVRAVWYTNGCPSIKKLVEANLVPVNENGETANVHAIIHWFDDQQWILWKDTMDAELSVQIEKRLMTERMKLVKEQLRQSGEIRKKAYEDITEKGFDSSASAVRAFFDAMTEERGLLQIDKMIAELADKDTATLQKEIRELAERAGVSIVEGELKEEEKGENDE